VHRHVKPYYCKTDDGDVDTILAHTLVTLHVFISGFDLFQRL
jgi:hypothetical protein